jgi:hypothetical protein
MKRHILLVLLRAVLAAGVLYALPYSHMRWGEPYTGDGQRAFGMIMMFTIIGLGFAVLYLAVGSAIQFLLRRRAWRWTAIADAIMFTFLASILVHGGITAHYLDNGEPDSPANGSQPIRAGTNRTSSAAGSRR